MAGKMQGHSSMAAAMSAHPEMAHMMGAGGPMAGKMQGHSSMAAASAPEFEQLSSSLPVVSRRQPFDRMGGESA